MGSETSDIYTYGVGNVPFTALPTSDHTGGFKTERLGKRLLHYVANF